ncbi:MAG: hypothetical protein MJ238_05440 [Bacilli bacterium]|nr:hypothetical protein [Bacilli bacterium]
MRIFVKAAVVINIVGCIALGAWSVVQLFNGIFPWLIYLVAAILEGCFFGGLFAYLNDVDQNRRYLSHVNLKMCQMNEKLKGIDGNGDMFLNALAALVADDVVFVLRDDSITVYIKGTGGTVSCLLSDISSIQSVDAPGKSKKIRMLFGNSMIEETVSDPSQISMIRNFIARTFEQKH